ncbi:DUF3789 domain-containing protein [Enterococcus faecium]|nr:DUF3789 domain-containing protein [Enterococcus faecium]
MKRGSSMFGITVMYLIHTSAAADRVMERKVIK